VGIPQNLFLIILMGLIAITRSYSWVFGILDLKGAVHINGLYYPDFYFTVDCQIASPTALLESSNAAAAL